MLITETALTGNQLYSQMRDSKTKWVGVDDMFVEEPDMPKDKSVHEVALEAQRIRTFVVQYVGSAAQERQFLS